MWITQLVHRVTVTNGTDRVILDQKIKVIKMGTLKMREWKYRYGIAGSENAGLEFAGGQNLNSCAFSTLGLKLIACVLFPCTVVYVHVCKAMFVSTTCTSLQSSLLYVNY